MGKSCLVGCTKLVGRVDKLWEYWFQSHCRRYVVIDAMQGYVI